MEARSDSRRKIRALISPIMSKSAREAVEAEESAGAAVV
jgi:hypothetical protein